MSVSPDISPIYRLYVCVSLPCRRRSKYDLNTSQSFPTADLNHTVSISRCSEARDVSRDIQCPRYPQIHHTVRGRDPFEPARISGTSSEIPVIFGLGRGLTFVVSAVSPCYRHQTLFSTPVASTEDRIGYEDTLLGPVPFERCGCPSGPHLKGQMFFWLQRSSTLVISSSSRLLCGTFLPLSDSKVTVAPSMRQWLALLSAVQFERVSESYRLRFLSSAPSKPNSLVCVSNLIIQTWRT